MNSTTPTNLLSLTSIDGLNAMLDATQSERTEAKSPTGESFRAQTGKRKFSATFTEDDMVWILDAQGHQWGWTGDEWERFTDDDDDFVLETKREKRAA